MRQELQTGTITVLGKKGSGKSYLCNAICRLRRNVLCVDPLGNDDVSQPFGVEIAWDQLPKIGIPNKYTECRYRINLMRMAGKMDKHAAARAVFKFVRDASEAKLLPRPFTLYIDEVDQFGNAWANDPSLHDIANYGRHWKITTVVNARRYSAISKDWTSQSDAIILGPSVDRRADGKIVRELVGSTAERYWRGLKARQFISTGLDGMGYIRYSEYSRNKGYIEYTPLTEKGS